MTEVGGPPSLGKTHDPSAATISLREQPAEQPPKFKLGYRPELDGMRAVAIVMVMVFHSFWIWPSAMASISVRGWFEGVDMFFVLSGFLITTLLLEERDRNGRISFRGFYERRALRLLPSLYFVLACHFIYAALTGLSLRDELVAYAFIVGYIANFASAYLRTDILLYSFDHAWSLSVEEQYYLIFFPLLALGLHFIKRYRTIMWILVAALVAAICWRYALTEMIAFSPGSTSPPHGPLNLLYVRTDTRLDALLVGPIAALALRQGLRDSRLVRVLGPLALVYVLSFLYWGDNQSAWLYQWGFAPLEISWAIVIVWLLTAERFAIHRFLRCRPVVWLGRVSYEAYLWHLPIYFAIGSRWFQGPWAWLVATGFTLVASAFTYHLVARPFLQLKRRRAARLRGTMPAV